LIHFDIRSTSLLQPFLAKFCNPGEDILKCNSNHSILSVSALSAIALDTSLLREQIQCALLQSIFFCDSGFVFDLPPASMMAFMGQIGHCDSVRFSPFGPDAQTG
jgi:hypothetical protein